MLLISLKINPQLLFNWAYIVNPDCQKLPFFVIINLQWSRRVFGAETIKYYNWIFSLFKISSFCVFSLTPLSFVGYLSTVAPSIA